MKAQIWVLVNTKTSKLARDIAGGVGYATRKALRDCVEENPITKRYLTNPKYEIRKIEIEV